MRDLALFDLAIDSKLRGCDLVKLQVNDVMHVRILPNVNRYSRTGVHDRPEWPFTLGQNMQHGNTMLTRTMVVQQKTKQPVRFEIT